MIKIFAKNEKNILEILSITLLGSILNAANTKSARTGTCIDGFDIGEADAQGGPSTLDVATNIYLSGTNGGLPNQGTTNTACGAGAVAAGSGNQNTAIGTDSQAGNSISTNNNGNTALGFGAYAGSTTTTNDNIGIGTNSSSEGGRSVAIGIGATATSLNSVAIGSGATATRANQIVLGTSTNSFTLAGLASNSTFVGTSNQNGGTRVVTVNGSGNLETANLSNAVVNARLDSLEGSMKTLYSQIEHVGAIAAAFCSIPNLTSDNRRYGWGIGAGGYGSGWAGSAGCASKIGSNVWVNGAIAFTVAKSTPWGSPSSVAGRLGLFYQWGGNK